MDWLLSITTQPPPAHSSRACSAWKYNPRDGEHLCSRWNKQQEKRRRKDTEELPQHTALVQNRGAGSRRAASQHGASATLRREGPTRGQWRGGKPQRAATWRPPRHTAPGRTRPGLRPRRTRGCHTQKITFLLSPQFQERGGGIYALLHCFWTGKKRL